MKAAIAAVGLLPSASSWRFLPKDRRCRVPAMPGAALAQKYECDADLYETEASCCAMSLPERAESVFAGAIERRMVYSGQVKDLVTSVMPDLQSAGEASACLNGLSRTLDRRGQVVQALQAIFERASSIMHSAFKGSVCDACFLPFYDGQYVDQALESATFIALTEETTKILKQLAEVEDEREIADICWDEIGIDLNTTIHSIPSHDRMIKVKNRHWGFRPRDSLMNMWSEWVERVSTSFSLALSSFTSEIMIMMSAIGENPPSFMQVPHPAPVDENLPGIGPVLISPVVDLSTCYVLVRLSENSDPRLVEYIVQEQDEDADGCTRIYVEETNPLIATRQKPIHLPRLRKLLAAHESQFVRESTKLLWRRYPPALHDLQQWSMIVGGQVVSVHDADDPKFFERQDGLKYVPLIPNLGEDFDTSDETIAEATIGPYTIQSSCPDLQGLWQKTMVNTQRLVYGCYEVSYCGGHGDRFHGIMTAFLIALITSRRLYIDARHPVPLDVALKGFWKLPLADVASEAARYHFVGDTDAFVELLPKLLDEQARQVTLSTNLRMEGILARHSLTADLVKKFVGGAPYWAHCAWDFLFSPTPDLFDGVYKQIAGMTSYYDKQLGKDPPLRYGMVRGFPTMFPYIAIHFRAGNESASRWRDPPRHSLSELDLFLECAQQLERDGSVNVHGDIPYFLSSDVSLPDLNRTAGEDSLFRKLLSSNKLHYMHGRKSGTVHVDRSPPQLAISGFMESWIEYYVLANAEISVISNSFFGETAAEIGRTRGVYYYDGCFPVDLSGA